MALANKEEEKFADNYESLNNALRDAHQEYKNRLVGGSLNVPLLQDVDKQKNFREDYINSISSIPEPSPLHLEAHEMQRRLMETIAGKADPSEVRKLLANFFTRRASNLQHKKYKLLIRWAHHIQTAQLIDKVGMKLDPLLAKLQTEFDLATERCERLNIDDGFGDFYKVDKPHPTATEGKHTGKPLYIEAEERLPCSSVRQDDIDVYLRVKTFRNQIFRVSNKLLSLMKWMKYADRYEILREARRSMMKLRNDHNKKQRELCTIVSDTLREKLVRAGIDTEKVVTAVVETYTKSLRTSEYSSKADQLLSTTTYDYMKLPLLQTLAIELKIYLKDISKEFDITGDLEVDNGHSFIYQIQVHFPVLFQKHVENSKFDLYDTFPVDEEGSSMPPRDTKSNQLANMESYTRTETKKSMLGYINTDDLPQITGDISKDTVLKTESTTKLRSTYWLPYITFKPAIDPLYNKQMILFQEKTDTLLASYFDFLDVNDCSAVNKILDDASILHTQRAEKRNPLRDESGKFISIEKEFEQNMNLAISREENKKSLQFEIEPLIEPIPNHIVKGLYMLRYLKARDFKSKLLNAMNYYREIQKRLTCDMMEMGSRDRLNLNCSVISPKDIANNSKKLLRKPTMNDLLLEALEAESEIDHFVSIKGFKHKKMFKPKVTATSPCLPKLHIAYEGVVHQFSKTEEQDESNSGELPSEKARRLRGRICKREFNRDNTDVTIIDEEGVSIMYDSSLHDIVSLEEELLKIGTFYIRKQEYLIDVEVKEPVSSIDRGEISAQLLEQEHQFQYTKIKLIEELMKVYEHTCDMVEQQRLVQIMADIMAKRPRFNTDATHFIDSYKSEIKYFSQLTKFLKEVIGHQMKSEKQICNDIKDHLELKYRKINDHIDRKWEYKNPDKKDQHDDPNENLEDLDENDEEKMKEQENKKQRLANIAKRHITDFTKNYDQDFTEVLGLPEITADDLFKKNREKEPIVIDALRQQARFVKIEEGYPHFLQEDDILDFYEGLS